MDRLVFLICIVFIAFVPFTVIIVSVNTVNLRFLAHQQCDFNISTVKSPILSTCSTNKAATATIIFNTVFSCIYSTVVCSAIVLSLWKWATHTGFTSI